MEGLEVMQLLVFLVFCSGVESLVRAGRASATVKAAMSAESYEPPDDLRLRGGSKQQFVPILPKGMEQPTLTKAEQMWLDEVNKAKQNATDASADEPLTDLEIIKLNLKRILDKWE